MNKWKPENRGTYCTVEFDNDQFKFIVVSKYWLNNAFDTIRFEKGLVFSNINNAEKAAETLNSIYEKNY